MKTGAVNDLWQPVYDTVQLPAAAGVEQYFTVPNGGALTAVANKTYAHTNMIQAGRLEAGVSLRITGISAFVRDLASGAAVPTYADYITLYNTSFINVLISQVSMLRVPLYLIPSGTAELQYFSNIAAAATEFHVNHGLGSVNNVYDLGNNYLDLAAGQGIVVELTHAALAAVTDMTIVLHGIMNRNVV